MNLKVRIVGFRCAILVALGLVSITTAAYAECSASGCWGVYIEELYPESQGGAWIKTSGDETLANCTVDGNVYLRLNDSPGFKAIYATLLAAQLADKKVSIRIAEGSAPCSVIYVTLNRNTW